MATSRSRAGSAIARLIGFGSSVVLLAAAALAAIPAMIAASGEAAWGGIALGQAVGAIGAGPVKAELDPVILAASLRQRLSLKRGIAAMKFVDRIPADVPVEEGPQFWCAICGDVFDVAAPREADANMVQAP